MDVHQKDSPWSSDYQAIPSDTDSERKIVRPMFFKHQLEMDR
jgi:hypothetical protein